MTSVEHEFYVYIYDGSIPEGSRITTADMLFVGSCFITLYNGDDNMTTVAYEFNSRLREFLRANKIYQFIPMRLPTKEVQDGKVSICYYHSKPAYDMIYAYYPKYINTPATSLYDEFEALYKSHDLDGWYDPRSNTTVGVIGKDN